MIFLYFCTIFAFGGGFRGGSRDSASFMPFFRFLVENGVTVVSTDYYIYTQKYIKNMIFLYFCTI